MFSEKYFEESLFCIEEAAKNLGLNHRRFSKTQMILEVELESGKTIRFWRNKNPFNDAIASRISADKSHQSEYFKAHKIPAPKNISFINPYCDERYAKYREAQSIEEIVNKVEQTLDYPIVVKKNRSSLSKGVHLAHKRAELRDLIQNYFNEYTNIILNFQEFIIGREFRVIAYKGEPLLAYEKITEKGIDELKEHGDINPLHSGKAVKVKDPNLLLKFKKSTQKTHKAIDLNFGGFDILLTKDNETKLIEVNSNPACFFYNRDNGRKDFIKIYEFILNSMTEARPKTKSYTITAQQLAMND